jgi:hypothetical protein
VTPFGRNERLTQMLHDTMRDGVERGDVRADLDPGLAIEVLKAAYAWNYRMAACRQAPASELSLMMDQQIAFIARGWKP